jgi:hypothetical protein
LSFIFIFWQYAKINYIKIPNFQSNVRGKAARWKKSMPKAHTTTTKIGQIKVFGFLKNRNTTVKTLIILAWLQKVHLAYRMVNNGRVVS